MEAVNGSAVTECERHMRAGDRTPSLANPEERLSIPSIPGERVAFVQAFNPDRFQDAVVKALDRSISVTPRVTWLSIWTLK